MPRLALAALLSLAVAGCGVAGDATIDASVTVYVSLPLSGPRGPDGRDAADGARLALEEAAGKAGSIERAARDAEWPEVARIAHQIKGSAGGYGFPTITEAAERLEKAARGPEPAASVPASVDPLLALCGRATLVEV